MENFFRMEWNMEWKSFSMDGYGMEEILQYGVWKNRLSFHSIACPALCSCSFYSFSSTRTVPYWYSSSNFWTGLGLRLKQSIFVEISKNLQV